MPDRDATKGPEIEAPDFATPERVSARPKRSSTVRAGCMLRPFLTEGATCSTCVKTWGAQLRWDKLVATR